MAKNKAQAETATPDDGESSGKSKKKWIIIGAAVLLILLLAGGGAWFFLGSGEETPEEEDPPPEEESAEIAVVPTVDIMYPNVVFTDTMLIDLSHQKKTWQLMVKLGFEIFPPDAANTLKSKIGDVQDAVTKTLQPVSPYNLMTLPDKIQLKLDLCNAVAPFIADGRITNVYLMDFVMKPVVVPDE